MLLFVLAMVLSLAALVALVGIGIYLLATVDVFFTLVPEGEIKFVLKGESLHRTIANVQNWYYDPAADETKTEGPWYWDKPTQTWQPQYPPPKSWLGEKYGIYWLGIPFIFQILWYRFIWDKWLHKESREGDDERQVIDHRDEPVDSLYFQFTYPIVAKGVELGDNYIVDIYINVTIQARKPYVAIFLLKGQWFLPLAAAIQGALTDYANQLTFNELRGDDKEGEEAPLVVTVKALNYDQPVWRPRGEPEVSEDGTIKPGKIAAKAVMLESSGTTGVIAATGMEIIHVNFVRFAIAGDDDGKVLKATQAKEIATMESEAVVIRAKADADAITARGNAEAAVLERKFKAAASVKDGARVLEATEQAQGVKEFQGQFLNLGGQTGGPLVTVDASAPPPPPSPAPPP